PVVPGWKCNQAFSPDGNQIAFQWSREPGGTEDIYVKLIGSERPLQLTTDPAVDTCPTWSPDGRQIAFVRCTHSEHAVYTVAALGGPERKLLSGGTGGGRLDWSPDGKYIAWDEKR